MNNKQSGWKSNVEKLYPEARQFRFPCYTSRCGLSFKARLLWAVLLYGSRKNKGYSFRALAGASGIDRGTISKLVKTELQSWVKAKDVVYAAPPPEGAVKQSGVGKWQDTLASIRLLLPIENVKPLEAVILSVLISGKKRQVDLQRILAVSKNTVKQALCNLIKLCLISDDLEPRVPTAEQQSWFVRSKKKAAPSYNPDLPNIKLLTQQGYPSEIIDAAIALDWLTVPYTTAHKIVNTAVAKHIKNKHPLPHSGGLFIWLLRKSKTKHRKPQALAVLTPVVQAQLDLSEEYEQQAQRMRKIYAEQAAQRKAKEQAAQTKTKEQAQAEETVDPLDGLEDWLNNLET